RLILRWMTTDDAPFILELVNEPSWLYFIGDRGVRTMEDARDYIRNGPIEMYARLGFGLYLTERKEDSAPIGICGLLKRDSLEDELREALTASEPSLRRLSEEEASRTPAPGKWSAKQILGHLIDSASNNHQRFVRAQFTDDLVFPGYEQKAWVSAQRYQEASWP